MVVYSLSQWYEFRDLAAEQSQTDLAVLMDFTSFEEPSLEHHILALDSFVIRAKFRDHILDRLLPTSENVRKGRVVVCPTFGD